MNPLIDAAVKRVLAEHRYRRDYMRWLTALRAARLVRDEATKDL